MSRNPSSSLMFTRPFRWFKRGLWLPIVLALLVALAPVGWLGMRLFAAAGDLTVTVYEDVNRNGVNDGEPPIPAVGVRVYNADNLLIRQDDTDPTGNVTFSGLTVGAPYRLEVVGVGDYSGSSSNYVVSVPGPDNVGTVSLFLAGGGGDSFSVGLRQLSAALPSGTDPAGLPNRTALVRVWEDRNGDGIQDPDETGFPGLTLQLLNGAGSLVDTATEIAPGQYRFLDTVPTGPNFRVVVDGGVPAGYVLSPANQVDGNTFPDGRDSDANIGTNVGVTLPSRGAGVNTDSFDIGFARGGVSGFIWRDIDADGLVDLDEPGINGVTVELWQGGAATGLTFTTRNIIDTTDAGNAGYFEFTGLDPLVSDYAVRVPGSQFDSGAVLFGAASSPNGVGLEDDRGLVFPGAIATAAFVDPASNFVEIPIDLTANGGFDNTAFFGFFKGSVAGRVWYDRDQSGTIDLGPPPETGIFEVTVCVDLDVSNTCEPGEPTTQTTSTGSYDFDDLPLGADYNIAVSQVNFAPGALLEGLGNSTGTAIPAAPADPGFVYIVSPVLDATTPQVAAINFGITRAEVGNIVFEDNNGNGAFDVGEPGINDVTVRVFGLGPDGVIGGDDPLVGTFVTADDPVSGDPGYYNIASLPSGDYYATFALSTALDTAGYTVSTVLQTGYPGVDPTNAVADLNDIATFDTTISAFRTADFSVTAGSINPGVDGAVYRPVPVSGKVFFDQNDDAIDNAGSEPGMSGVDVTLISLGPDGVLGGGDDRSFGPVTTDGDGAYSFPVSEGVPPGAIVIEVTNPDPANFAFVAQDIGDDALDSDIDPATGQTTAGTYLLTSGGADVTDIDAGFTGTTSVAGYTFIDSNGTGLQDGGDSALGGVEVALTHTINYPALGLNDVAVTRAPVTTTAGDGTYSFANLPGGVYSLAFTDTAGTYLPTFADANDPAGLTPSAIDSDGNAGPEPPADTDQLLDQVLTGGTAADRDQGYYEPVEVSGLVFFDGNFDDIYDGGTADAPLANISVTLRHSGPDGAFGTGDDLTWNDTTATDGAYTFATVDQVPPGDLRVEVANPEVGNWVFVTQSTALGDAADDSDVDASGVSHTITLTSGTAQTDANAGFIGSSTVSGYTFVDGEYDGQQDTTTPGSDALEAVGVDLTLTVDLSAYDGSATFAVTPAPATTGADGLYSFSDLAAGTFDLAFTPPTATPAYAVTVADVAPEATDSDSDLTGQSLAGAAMEDRDQGYYQPVEVSGLVFFDGNFDDVYDGGTDDAALDNVSVTLRHVGPDGTFATPDDVTRSDTTAGGGLYSFDATTDVPPGNVRVEVANPASGNWVFVAQSATLTTATDDSDVDATGISHVITAASGGAQADVNAGFIGSGTVSGYTFLDAEYDGQQDTATPGSDALEAVDVDLSLDVDLTAYGAGTLTVTPATATTGADGLYSFSDLAAGTFDLTFTPPAATPAYAVTVADVAPEATDSDGDLTGQALAGAATEDRDQGYYQPVEVSGLVFFDGDFDDLYDGGTADAALDAVDVTLRHAGPNGTFGDGDDVTFGPVATAAGGAYSFTAADDVPPGTMRIEVTNPASGNWVFVAQSATLTTATNDSDVDATGISHAITPASGGAQTDVNAGFIGSGTVSGYTFVDGEYDGQQAGDGSDALAGVEVGLTLTVDLSAYGGAATFAVTPAPATTGADGLYSFSDLAAGTFDLAFTPPAATPAYAVTVADVAPEATDSDSDLTGQALAGAATEDRDQGYYQPVEVSGLVFFDGDFDDLSGGNDAGLGQIDVTLLHAGPNGTFGDLDDVTFAPATTAAGGAYSFTAADDVPPGTMRVAVATPAAEIGNWVFVAQSATLTTATNDSDVDASGVSHAFTLGAGGSQTAVDAGFIGSGTVSGYTFVDNEYDGQQAGDGSDALAGVAVDLSLSVDLSAYDLVTPLTVTPASATTAADGLYGFTELAAGTFDVSFTPPTATPAYAVTVADVAPEATDSDSDLTGQTLAGGATAARDQGYYQPVEVSGLVFFDGDFDAVYDGGTADRALDGVDVTLVHAGPDGDFLATGDNLTFGPRATSGGGLYAFAAADDVPPGDVRVEVTNPEGGNWVFVTQSATLTTATNDSDVDASGVSHPITLSAGGAAADVNAGFIGSGTVEGYTFVDAEYDGQQDTTTPGSDALAGVEVNLSIEIDLTAYGAGILTVTPATATTAADGLYGFSELAAGTFGLTFTPPTVDPAYQPTIADVAPEATDSDSDLTGQTLAGGATAARDQGYVQSLDISGRVFYDLNANDLDETTPEPGLSGLTVTLYRAGTNGTIDFGGDDTTTTATTAADGSYSFTGVLPGPYGIAVENPTGAGFSFVTQDAGDDTLDSDVDPAGQVTDTATSGSDLTDIDAGLVGTATVTGYTFVDGNGNGLQGDAADADLGGVTVEFSFTPTFGGLALPAFTPVTTAAGDPSYSFANLPAGTFDLTFTPPTATPAYAATLADQGADDGIDSDGNLTGQTLAGGATADRDQGFVQPATVTARVFEETVDYNNAFDTGEPGIANVTVTFQPYGPDGALGGGDDPTAITETTGADGTVTFSVPPGSGEITYDTAAAELVGYTLNPATVPPLVVGPLTAGEVLAAEQLFPFYRALDISGRVFYDLNGNNLDETTPEPGLGGLTVTLYRPGLNGTIDFGDDDVTTPATTAADGSYSFTGQAPGPYGIEVENPAGAGFAFVAQDAGDDTLDSDVAADGRVSGTAVSNSAVTDLDAGLVGAEAIAGRTFIDVNGDGLQDGGDSSFAGVEVSLTLDPTFAGLATIERTVTSTAADPSYSFTNLPAGTFSLAFTPPDTTPAYQETLADVGADDGIDSDGGELTAQTLAVSGVPEDRDIGYVQLVRITARVFDETVTINNAFDSGESGLANVRVDLSNTVTQDLFFQQTNADGLVEFEVLPGTYELLVNTTPTGYFPSPGNTGAVGPITLASGESALTDGAGANSFGYYRESTISGTAWFDSNGNGLLDTAEDTGLQGMQNITVRLVGDVSGELASDITNSLGEYGFTGVGPTGAAFADNSYRLCFSLPTSFAYTTRGSDLTTDGNSDAGIADGCSTPFTVSSNNEITYIDAGYVGVETLGNLVWDDEDGDGIQDAGEPGLGGVTVTATIESIGINATNPTIVVSTTTVASADLGANYLLTGLPPASDVTITVSDLPLGYVPTLSDQGGDDTLDSDPLPNSYGALPPATTDLDFGFYQTGAVGDQVWLDLNANGTYEAAVDAGYPGITVRLLDGADGTTVLATTTTDAAGNYQFAELDPGAYLVEFVAPAGVTPVSVVGSLATDNDNDIGPDGRTAVFTLTSRQALATVDAGFVGQSSISGIAWIDANGNNVRDDSDTDRLAGVQVTLTLTPQGGLGAITGTTTTAADGSYSFANLPPGSWEVRFNPPFGRQAVVPNAGSDDTRDSEAPLATGTLTAGEAIANIDAGYGPAFQIFLPTVVAPPRQNLVTSFTVTPANPSSGTPLQVAVTVTNTGTLPASNFWVDLYVNPREQPAVNKPWNEIADLGVAWFVRDSVAPGQSITLITVPRDPGSPNGFEALYTRWGELFPAGNYRLVALADSWNRDGTDPSLADPRGAVIESSEVDNLFERTFTVAPTTAAVAATPALDDQPAPAAIPPRPRQLQE